MSTSMSVGISNGSLSAGVEFGRAEVAMRMTSVNFFVIIRGCAKRCGGRPGSVYVCVWGGGGGACVCVCVWF